MAFVRGGWGYVIPGSAYARRECNVHSRRRPGPTVWRAAGAAGNCSQTTNIFIIVYCTHYYIHNRTYGSDIALP